ncbi:hypothetical protein OG562_20630 [Streptomyces sp. NBC_01275]|uniref:hypothetical protein n=1 Tax=Streptomyces sp. NBC_01275 TaxID=2903807 RepID=UPI0022589D43|nr:hypothetical protein [Streptomyces sp. NBC_01275]MCX4763332.1 hypothetical protein [Streptomyces sp. NBC_01275]
MRRMNRAASVVAGIAALVLGASTQAYASADSGWVYTDNKGGKAYFDADVKSGNKEKVTVCDLKTNNRAVKVEFYLTGGGDGADSPIHTLVDKDNDGKCVSKSYNWFGEERDVTIAVLEYHGSKTYNMNFGHATS